MYAPDDLFPYLWMMSALAHLASLVAPPILAERSTNSYGMMNHLYLSYLDISIPTLRSPLGEILRDLTFRSCPPPVPDLQIYQCRILDRLTACPFSISPTDLFTAPLRLCFFSPTHVVLTNTASILPRSVFGLPFHNPV